MGQSFIRNKTDVICTNMTCFIPRQICRVERECGVMNTATDEPILNIDDKKISDCFVCKMPIKKWGGLLTFLAGVVVGALCVAAIVVTGGVAAGVFAAVAVSGYMATAAIIVGVTGAVYGIVKGIEDITHDCDETKNAEWNLPHSKVYIEGKKALLNHSFTACPIGGTINIIVSHTVAKQAARFISGMNTLEIHQQLKNKFQQGVVSGLTGGANPVALFISIGLYIDPFNWGVGESGISNIDSNGSIGKSTEVNAGSSVAVSVASEVVEKNIATATGNAVKTAVALNKATTAVVASQSSIDAFKGTLGNLGKTSSIPGPGQTGARILQSQTQRQLNIEMAKQGHLADIVDDATSANAQAVSAKFTAWKNFGIGLGLGLAGSVVNGGLEYASNEVENCLEDITQEKSNYFNNSDDRDSDINENFMQIVATKA